MRPQRKIHHLLDNNGKTGRDFKYVPRENPLHSFDWEKPFLASDKIDGTTCQATCDGVFQRRDLFKKGDPRKFTASEEERYTTVLLDLEAPNNVHILRAVMPYLSLFEDLLDNVCVYFEAFGDKIQGRYPGVVPDIMVHGMTANDNYLSLEFVQEYCGEYLGFPVVPHTKLNFRNVMDVIEALKIAKNRDPRLLDFELEGWVLYQRNQVAKIRKDDMRRFSYDGL